MTLCYTHQIVINWFSVGINSLWLAGSALILAALSYYQWEAAHQKRPFRQHLTQSRFPFFLWLGLLAISISLTFTSQRTWEMVVWIIFSLLTAVNAYQTRHA